jgi:RNA polymerase sigma-70 factor (ECF subfamily)
MAEFPKTRESLIARVRDPRDSVAWEQFAAIYLPMVRAYCVRRGLQEADAGDITQDVMAAVARAVRNFEYDPRRGGFRNWLFTVTRNQLGAFFEQHARRKDQGSGRTSIQQMLRQQPDDAETQEWDREYRQHLFEWAARQARADFEGATWKAFVLIAVESRPAAEAAEATGLTLNAVYVAKSRVLARLRELVRSVAEEDRLL